MTHSSTRSAQASTARWKRPLDLSLASVGLAIVAVPMLVVAMCVRTVMGSPVLHRVARPGLGARPFVLVKFRTMTDSVDQHGCLLPDRARITPLGRFLRKTSLDELPQLFNVLNGDMSLVGPRPLKIEYLKSHTPEQMRRHEVKPGITGLAQINGRNALSWEERFALDVRYVSEASLRLDMTILMQTAWELLKGKSVSRDGDLDVPSFGGSAGTGWGTARAETVRLRRSPGHDQEPCPQEVRS